MALDAKMQQIRRVARDYAMRPHYMGTKEAGGESFADFLRLHLASHHGCNDTG
jgi:hypothetical protein